MRHLLLVCCLTVSLAQAETYVITAGVEKYDDERISSLKYANADAKSVAQAFRGSGVPRQNVTLLTSDETDGARRPTRGNLLRALQNARQRAVTGDKLVFYFAGHGIEQEGEHYLLTVDAQVDLVQDMSLPMRLVNKALDGLQASEVLFILDACRNDPQKGRGDADAKLSDGLARGLQPMFKTVATVPRPRVVATLLACDAGERAWEDPEAGHGVFTLYLAKGLAGQAAKDGRVTLSGLAAYVQQQVSLWAARAKRTQTPKLLNAEGGDMVLLVPPAEPLVSVSFQNETLARVVDQLAQQYGVQVVLGKGVNPDAKVTGRLENLSLSTTLKALLAAHNLTVRREGTVYIIEEPGQAPAPAVVRIGLGAESPTGAVVLFAGQDTSAWRRSNSDAPCPWLVQDGLLVSRETDIWTRQAFTDYRLHLEFRLPPADPQTNVNSLPNGGVYLQGRYEIQIISAVAPLPPETGLGSIYRLRAPSQQAGLPDGQWQSLDADFRAARLGADGQIEQAGTLTAWLNGKLIHDRIELRNTYGAMVKAPATAAPLVLQCYKNTAIAYRNIWLLPAAEAAAK